MRTPKLNPVHEINKATTTTSKIFTLEKSILVAKNIFPCAFHFRCDFCLFIYLFFVWIIFCESLCSTCCEVQQIYLNHHFATVAYSYSLLIYNTNPM